VERSMVMTTEETAWVARAKAGDQAAFASLFARYERRIYAFSYRMMGNPDDAFDLTQETFLKAFRALDKTDKELNVNAWLHRIASNACMDVLRRRQRIRWLPWEGSKHDRASGVLEDNPEGAVIGDETQRIVQRVLDKMSPRNRQAMVLREYEGLSCEDIGDIMGVSRSAVKSILFRGREEFRKLYLQQEGQS
jgi:RNA polymerase sigma-70 factor (ECF subfamily)